MLVGQRKPSGDVDDDAGCDVAADDGDDTRSGPRAHTRRRGLKLQDPCNTCRTGGADA